MNERFAASLVAAALAALALPGAGQNAGPQKTLSGDLQPGFAAGNQSNPFIEPGATNSLAVWVDNRTNLGHGPLFVGDQTGSDVFGMRLDGAGNPIDAAPIPITMAFGDQTSLRATWNGSSWLITWIGPSKTPLFFEDQLWGMRMAPDGSLLDSQPFVILSGTGSVVGPQVESNGTDWLVVTQGLSGTGLLGIRVAANGTVLDATPKVLAPPIFFLYSDLQVNSAGGNYLVTYDGTQSSQDAWQAQLYDSGLTPVGAPFTVPHLVTIEGSPTTYLMTKVKGNQVVGQRLNASGTLLDVPPFPVTNLGLVATAGNYGLVFDGANWWVNFRRINDIRVARVSLGGVSLDLSAPIVTSSPSSGVYFAGASTAGGLDILKADGQVLFDVTSQHFDQNLTPSASVPVSTGAPSQEFADMAPIPGGFAIVWTDYLTASSKVMLQLVDEFGAATGAPLEIAPGSTARVASNGSLLAVSYTGSAFGQPLEVLTQRVSFAGVLLDSSPIKVMDGSSGDVEALGGDFLFAGTNNVGLTGSPNLSTYLRRMDSSGSMLDPAASPVGYPYAYAQCPRVVAAGNRWLVAYERDNYSTGIGQHIWAMFVDAAGVAAPEFMVATGGTPTVASSPTSVLFAWRTGSSIGLDPAIYGRRMLLDGTLLDTQAGFAIGDAPDMQINPSAAWNGNAFQVGWMDRRNAVILPDKRTDIYGNRVTESGVVLDGNGVALVDDEIAAKNAALASAPHGGALMAYSRFSTEPAELAYRVRTRLVGSWGDEGLGLDGSEQLDLDGAGPLAMSSAVVLHLGGAEPAAAGAFVMGAGTGLTPLFGGTLVPSLDVLVFFTTDAQGQAEVSLPVGVSLTGLTVHAQAWAVDTGGPQGFAASNAIFAVGN